MTKEIEDFQNKLVGMSQIVANGLTADSAERLAEALLNGVSEGMGLPRDSYRIETSDSIVTLTGDMSWLPDSPDDKDDYTVRFTITGEAPKLGLQYLSSGKT